MPGLVDIDVNGIFNGLGTLAKDIRQAITGKDPESDAKLILMESELLKAQAAINLAEAQNTHVFVSGARPFIIWVCGFGVAIRFLVIPVLAVWVKIPDIVFDTSPLIGLLIPILGLGAYRTIEKTQGVASK
jgi:hypothetical protein